MLRSKIDLKKDPEAGGVISPKYEPVATPKVPEIPKIIILQTYADT